MENTQPRCILLKSFCSESVSWPARRRWGLISLGVCSQRLPSSLPRDTADSPTTRPHLPALRSPHACVDSWTPGRKQHDVFPPSFESLRGCRRRGAAVGGCDTWSETERGRSSVRERQRGPAFRAQQAMMPSPRARAAGAPSGFVYFFGPQ